MEYKGKLYGHLSGKMYFDTGKTADDWDALEKRVAELEAENQALIHPLVMQLSEQLVAFVEWLEANSDNSIDKDWIHEYIKATNCA